MSICKEDGKFIPHCDNCPEVLPPANTFIEAITEQVDADWENKFLIEREWVTLCTTCQSTKK